MEGILFFILILGLYFLPSIIGYKHRNANSICLLNFFLGWTFIGWIVALIWAVSAENKKEVMVVDDRNSITEKMLLLKELYEDGTLTKEEYDNEKKLLLRK